MDIKKKSGNSTAEEITRKVIIICISFVVIAVMISILDRNSFSVSHLHTKLNIWCILITSLLFLFFETKETSELLLNDSSIISFDQNSALNLQKTKKKVYPKKENKPAEKSINRLSIPYLDEVLMSLRMIICKTLRSKQ